MTKRNISGELEQIINKWFFMCGKILSGAILLFISFLFITCNKLTEPTDSYSKILFSRIGGGAKDFCITTNSGHEIFMNVTKYHYKDTNYTTSVFIEDSGKLSDLIANVINKKVAISGDFKQPKLPTGTWAYLYVVSGDRAVAEITNIPVRDSIMVLESLVDNARSEAKIR